MLDQIQDPGNVGTIIRSGLAFGVEAIILGKGTVDLYNEKVVRATQGALFHFPVIQSDLFEWLNKRDIVVYGTALMNKRKHYLKSNHLKRLQLFWETKVWACNLHCWNDVMRPFIYHKKQRPSR